MRKSLQQETVDQGAHLLVGFILTSGISYFGEVPWFYGFIIMMMAATIREFWQIYSGISNKFGWGSILDLTFFGIGGLAVLLT